MELPEEANSNIHTRTRRTSWIRGDVCGFEGWSMHSVIRSPPIIQLGLPYLTKRVSLFLLTTFNLNANSFQIVIA